MRRLERRYPNSNLSCSDGLANDPIEDYDDLQARSRTRSHTVAIFHPPSQHQEDEFFIRKSEKSDIHANTIDSKREQLGGNGLALLDKLEDMADGPVVPVKLKQRLAEADMRRVKQQQFDPSDGRPVDELLWELRTIQDLVSLSHRCSVNRDHQTEWNNRVHTKCRSWRWETMRRKLVSEACKPSSARPRLETLKELP